MITASVSGRITKDATIRQAGSSNVCSFGMASNKKVKGQDVTTFVDVSIFGKRGESLCQYLTKGSFVVVYGELSTRDHNGKTYVQLDAQGVEFGPKSGARSGSGERQERAPAAATGGGGSAADDYGDPAGKDDDIPF